MRKATIISFLLLWVWVAITLSTDYYWIDSHGRGVKESVIRLTPKDYRNFLAPKSLGGGGAKRKPRVDEELLVWLLLPPVLMTPLLWQLWRRK